MRPALRIDSVQPPVIPIVGELIRRNPGTISLGQGVVSYGPPAAGLDALRTFPSTPTDHHYGPVEGSAELVEAISRKLESENGIATGSERRVVVTAGGNMAFVNAVLAVTDPGDEVILQAPFYFNHDMAVVLAGCRTVAVPTDRTYQLRLDAIRAALSPRTRAVVTISPNNPSGAVYPEPALREVNDLCAAHAVYHVHDEAYEYFTYDGARHFSPGAIEGSAPHTISLFSLSKTYGMASWRVGYMVIPAHLFDAVNKIQDTNLICPPAVSQAVACGALSVGAEYCRERVRALAEVRQFVLEAFKAYLTDRKVEFKAKPKQDDDKDASKREYYGAIQDFVSIASFTVNGMPVDASGAKIEDGKASALGNGVFVEVEGTLQGDKLIASELEFKGPRGGTTTTTPPTPTPPPPPTPTPPPPTPTPPPPPAPTPPPPPAPTPPPPPAPGPSAANGKVLYSTAPAGVSLSCATCHGAPPDGAARKGANAPSQISAAIAANRGNMGIYSGKYSAQQLSDLAAYLAGPTF